MAQTNIVASRDTAILAEFQTAKGIVVDDFSLGTRIWFSEGVLNHNELQGLNGPWNLSTLAVESAGQYLYPEEARGLIRAKATYSLLDLIFKNAWGTEVAGVFTPFSQIPNDKYLTLAFLDSKVLSSAKRVTRVSDVVFDNVSLIVNRKGVVEVVASFVGKSTTYADINSGTVTLPSSVPDGDRDVMAGRSAYFMKGLSLLPFSTVEINILNGVIRRWFNTKGASVYKSGKFQVFLNFSTRRNDEALTIEEAVRGGALDSYYLEVYSLNKTLTITLNAVAFNIQDGWSVRGKEGVTMEFRGKAEKDSSGNYVDIELI